MLPLLPSATHLARPWSRPASRWRGLPLLGLLGLASAASAQTFSTVANYTSAGSASYSVAAGDVNGDGRRDIVTGNDDGTVSVLLGQATAGTFGAATTYAGGGYYAYGVTLSDLNGDGRLDIVASSFNSSAVSVLLNSATTPGTFGTAAVYPTGGSGATRTEVADINGDGRRDLVAVNFSSGTVSVLLNSATTPGTFGTGTVYSTGGGGGSFDLGVADLNGDGRLDIAASNGSDSNIAILLGSATTPGTFGAAVTYSTGAGTVPRGLELGDLNGDGRLDLVTADYYGTTAIVLLNSATTPGTFGTVATYPLTNNGPFDVALGDVTGDGRLDIITANQFSNTVAVLPAQGAAGTFGTDTTYPVGPNPLSVIAADVNADGRLDLVAGASSGSAGAASVLLNTGTFAVVTNLTVSTTTTIPAGTYNNITVTGTGTGTLAGNVTVTGALTVQNGGTLNDGCYTISGAGSFTLAAGATLGICNPAGIAAAPATTGAIQNTGTRSFNADASYVYNGTAAQVTGTGLPAQVRNLSITNKPNYTVRATLSQAVSIAQVLTVASNNSLALNNNALTLLSSAAGTALVDVGGVTNPGIVSGTATVQRYIDASGNLGTSGYRHYSSPVSGSTVADLTTTGFTPVVNADYNTAANTLAPAITAQYPTVYGYNQARVGSATLATNLSAFDQGYASPAALTETLQVGQGYTVQIGNQELVDFTGTLVSNDVNSFLLRNLASDGGWALIGNPYPAPLDWGTVTNSQLTDVDAAAYVFQSTGAYTGRYTSFVNGVGAGTGLIATGQGFFVRASASVASAGGGKGTPYGTVTLTNANRVTTYAATPKFQRQASTRPLVRLSLGLGSQPATVATAQDEAFVYLEAGATSAFDGRFDAHKLLNPSSYYLASASADATPLGLSISGRAPLTSLDDVVPLWLSVPAGTYTLTATELANFAPHAVYLRDALTGTLTDLSTTASYGFSVAANAAYAGRFSLVLRGASALATTSATASALTSLYPNPAAAETTLSVTGLGAEVRGLEAVLLNSLGQVVRHYAVPAAGGRAAQALPTAGLAAGVYLLRVQPLDAQGAALGVLPTQRLSVR